MSNYYPKFENSNNDTLILDHSFYSECLKYADEHKMNVLYTDTTCTGSIRTIMAFEKCGYSHKFYEVPQCAPGGLMLGNKIYCRFTR